MADFTSTANRETKYPLCYLWFLLGLGFIGFSGQSIAESNLVQEPKLFNWEIFDRIVKNHVREERIFEVRTHVIDYEILLTDPHFQEISDRLSRYDPLLLNRKEKIAFYINAYNYFAIKIVLDNWRVESIRDIGNLFSPVWKKTVGEINHQSVTLDGIEHEILRKLNEPRIHFAIVCASLSCPSLRTEIYTAAQLETQLEDQTRRFLGNEDKGARLTNQQLSLSKIFDWFEEDFDAAGGVLPFIARYHAEIAGQNSYKFLDYSWRLNTYSTAK